MATWNEEFRRLSDIHRQEWQKFIHGEYNQQAVRSSMDDANEMIRRWESAQRADRDDEISV